MSRESLSERVISKLFSDLFDELTGIGNDKQLVGISTEDKVTNINNNPISGFSKNQHSMDQLLNLSLFPVKFDDACSDFPDLNFPLGNSSPDPGIIQFENLDYPAIGSCTNTSFDLPSIF